MMAVLIDFESLNYNAQATSGINAVAKMIEHDLLCALDNADNPDKVLDYLDRVKSSILMFRMQLENSTYSCQDFIATNKVDVLLGWVS